MRTILVALLVIGAFAATHDQVVELIAKIDSTPFGHTLFETVFLQIQSGDPIDRVLGTLSDLEDRYFAEQKEDDANNNSFQQTCNVDIKAFDADLANSENEKIVSEAKLEGELYPLRGVLTGVVKAKENEIKGYSKKLDEFDHERAEQNAEFEEKVNDHNEAAAIITEAKRLFESLVEGNFLQKKNAQLDAGKISFLQKHLHDGARRVNKFKHRKSYAQIFKILATITSQAQMMVESGNFDKIVQLCNDLLSQISNSLDLERFAESKRVEAYKKARNLIQVALNQTNVDYANLKVELFSINDKITAVETKLQNTNQRIANVSENRNDRYAECEEAAYDYQQARLQRSNDTSVLSDLIGLVNKELRTLKEQLALRLAAGDKI